MTFPNHRLNVTPIPGVARARAHLVLESFNDGPLYCGTLEYEWVGRMLSIIMIDHARCDHLPRCGSTDGGDPPELCALAPDHPGSHDPAPQDPHGAPPAD